ncbi:phage-associated protein, BcepMu gp16 family [Neisseria zoodegmatis]|uniref:Phage-associated protein, BcepMu gp16 family n=1 Tax=Neisseria zoodegmatis TaxID=326523 RepID=A0A378WIF5_9NEIS|nr:DNA-binding protein [Neisseria zoodegmatis]SUA36324.1 phage-associated protein, BcepMu gp16 family [Neisseria zoodegmatis]
MKKVLSPTELKEQFRDKGITFAGWAEENGYRPQDVYRVVNGFTKARRGKAHEIAVKLGLKAAA